MHGHLIYLISDRRAVGRVMMSLRERVSERARQSRRNRSCSCDGQCEYVGSTSRAPQFDGASQFLYSSRVRKKERERERGKLPAGTGTECLPLLLLSFYSACSSQTRAARRPGCEMDDTAARLAMSNRALEQAMQVDQAEQTKSNGRLRCQHRLPELYSSQISDTRNETRRTTQDGASQERRGSWKSGFVVSPDYTDFGLRRQTEFW
ncbi:hypothetical protein HDK64DRAFT_142543 [Phyllosticta capitalensis]